MSFIERKFRLNNASGSLGLSCQASGLALAGVSLLRQTDKGFVPRPGDEIAALLAAAYRGRIDPMTRLVTLDVVAKALNRGDVQLAMVAAVLLQLPELDWDAAARLAQAAERLAKYDKDEPRRADGEWTDEDDEGDDPGTAVSHDPDLDPAVARILEARTPEFEERYDYLGPVEFAEAAIEFGYQLGAKARDYSLPERQAALAEYEFLQDRLNFWLGYDFKPPSSQDNLRSAALALYQGAVTSGLVRVGGHLGSLPRSMLDVAGAAIWNDGAQMTAGLKGTQLNLAGTVPLRATEQLGEVGGIVENKIVHQVE